jgi:predicted ATP-grasp superfamily ATP-dependent carboligase
VYVAAGGEAALLGVTSQRLSETGGEACRFRYGGSLGPLELSDSLREQFERIGRRLSESFRLVGLFGVDAVVAGAAVWPIEVNPRYTASIEVLERALGIAAVGLHADACRLGRLPREVRRRRAWCGKAVLYARSKLVVPAAFSGCPETGTGTLHRVVDGRSTPNTPEPVPVSGQPLARLADDATRDGAWPALADVPDAGCTIRAGSPVATVLAEAETQEDLIERLANLEAQAERLLYADPEPGPGL